MSIGPQGSSSGKKRSASHDRVAAWPRVSAAVRENGSGSITVNGTERPCAAASVEELRTGVIARCASLAQRLRRPVRLTVTEGTTTWALAVRAEGIVQLIEEDGTIPPGDGLLPHEGRCRSCRRIQSVAALECAQCGLEEPHRVEANPVDVAEVVPDAAEMVAPQPPSSAGPETVAMPKVNQEAPAPRTLRLTFSTQDPVEASGGVALGRKPDAVDGRLPVTVSSPERMLSRTHVLIDIDEQGRIVATDQNSANGTETQTQPPVRLEPRTPFVLHEGTTLLLGDVAVVVDLV